LGGVLNNKFSFPKRTYNLKQKLGFDYKQQSEKLSKILLRYIIYFLRFKKYNFNINKSKIKLLVKSKIKLLIKTKTKSLIYRKKLRKALLSLNIKKFKRKLLNHLYYFLFKGLFLYFSINFSKLPFFPSILKRGLYGCK
jgi:hypothetical protein